MNVNKALIRFVKIAFSVMIALIIIYVGAALCSTAFDFGYRVFTEPAMTEGEGQDVLVQIKEGMSGREIGGVLEEKGLIRDGNLFYLQLMLSAYSKDMAPGVYTLNTSMTPKEMMVAISEAAEAREQEELSETEGTEKVNVGEDEGTAQVEEEE